MNKREAQAAVVRAFAPPVKRDDALIIGRTLIELRLGRLRLAEAEAQLMWAQACLASGTMNVAGALAVLDDAMEQVAGVKP